MRHMPVINQAGCICGIITRKDLMAHMLTEQRYTDLIKIKRVQRAMRKFLESHRKRLKMLFAMYAKTNPRALNKEELQALVLQYHRNLVVGDTSNLSLKDTQSLMDYILESNQGPDNDSNFLLVDDLADVLVRVRRWKPGWSKVD